MVFYRVVPRRDKSRVSSRRNFFEWSRVSSRRNFFHVVSCLVSSRPLKKYETRHETRHEIFEILLAYFFEFFSSHVII